MSDVHPRYGTIDLVLEAPDTRLRSGSFGAAMAQLFVLTLLPESAGFWVWIHTGLFLLSITLLLLAFTARQRTHVHSQSQTLHLERSVLRWVWRRETVDFDDVWTVAWGENYKAGAEIRPKDRLVSAELTDGDTLVLGSYPSAQETERLATELARHLGCSVDGASQEQHVLELVGLEPPDPLESEVTRHGDSLSIRLAPSLLTQQAIRWVGPYVLGLIIVVALVIGVFASSTRSGPDNAPWILLAACVLLILGGLLGLRARNRRFTPPTLRASREGLELTLPANFGSRRLDWTLFDSTGVSVITLRGKSALRFQPPPNGGTTPRAQLEPTILGRGLPEDELRWVADALRRALNGQLPPEVPHTEVPHTSATPHPTAVKPTSKGTTRRWPGEFIFFAIAVVGITAYNIYLDPEYGWMFLWLLLGITGLSVCFLFFQHIHRRWLVRRRRSKGHTFETFRAGFMDLDIPESALQKLYDALGERYPREGLPIVATDLLAAFYDLDFQNTLSAFEWLHEYCQDLDLPFPNPDELVGLRDVKDLVRLIDQLYGLREREA